jgi:hypothetical protein
VLNIVIRYANYRIIENHMLKNWSEEQPENLEKEKFNYGNFKKE